MALLSPLSRWGVVAALVVALAPGVGAGTGAQDEPIPAALQVSLLTKILSYDRSLPARAGQEIVVGVAYQSRFRPSLDLQRELLEAAAQTPALQIAHLPCRWVAVEVGDGGELGAAFAREGVDVLYLTPLRSLPLTEIVAATRARRITSATAVPEYLAQGVALGLRLRGERPEILVNLSAASAEGSELNSQLLKLATLVE